MPDPVIRELMDRQDRVDEQDEGGGRTVPLPPEVVSPDELVGPLVVHAVKLTGRQIRALTGMLGLIPGVGELTVIDRPGHLADDGARLVQAPDGRLYAIDAQGATTKLST